MKRFVGFAARVTVAHVVTYIGVGALAYSLLTREFFEGSAGLAAQVMRTPAEPALWAHVTRWALHNAAAPAGQRGVWRHSNH